MRSHEICAKADWRDNTVRDGRLLIEVEPPAVPRKLAVASLDGAGSQSPWTNYCNCIQAEGGVDDPAAGCPRQKLLSCRHAP